jgi:hypothetical protein
MYFYLANAPDTANPVKLEIVNSDGQVVRTYSAKRQPPAPGAPPTRALRVNQGLNRVVWDLRTEPLAGFAGVTLFVTDQGPRVPPGQFTVRLTAEGKTLTQPLTVRPDPRLEMSPDDLAREQRIAKQLYQRAQDIFAQVRTLRSVRDQVNRVTSVADLPNADSVRKLGTRIRSRIDSLEQALVQVRSTNGQDVINFRPGLISQVQFLADAMDESSSAPTQPMDQRVGEIDVAWQAIDTRIHALMDGDVAALNALLAGVPMISVPRPKPVP